METENAFPIKSFFFRPCDTSQASGLPQTCMNARDSDTSGAVFSSDVDVELSVGVQISRRVVDEIEPRCNIRVWANPVHRSVPCTIRELLLMMKLTLLRQNLLQRALQPLSMHAIQCHHCLGGPFTAPWAGSVVSCLRLRLIRMHIAPMSDFIAHNKRRTLNPIPRESDQQYAIRAIRARLRSRSGSQGCILWG